MPLIKYDPEADILAIKVKEGVLSVEELLDNDVVLGCDKDGDVVSIEVLDASKKGLTNAFEDFAKSERDREASTFKNK